MAESDTSSAVSNPDLPSPWNRALNKAYTEGIRIGAGKGFILGFLAGGLAVFITLLLIGLLMAQANT